MAQKRGVFELSQEQRRQALCAARVGLWNWDIPTNKLIVEQYNAGQGASKQPEFSATTLEAFVHAHDIVPLIETIRLHSDENTPFDVELRIRTPSNGWK